MVKIGAIVFVLFIVIFAFASFVSASYNINNYSIDKYYSGGDVIRGSLDITLNKQSANTLITSNFEGNITLIDLILNSSYKASQDFNCSITDCLSTYSISSAPINEIDIGSNENKIVGFKLTGNDITISDIRLNIKSDASTSCSKQIEIDLLANGEDLLNNYKFTNESCNNQKDYGCFNEGLSSDKYRTAEITGEKYCNKITLESAPAYWLGANIINTTSVNGSLIMTLYSSDWDYFGSCELEQITKSKQQSECLVEHSNNKESEMFVCISEKNGNSNANYKINTESVGEVCGVSQVNSDTYDGDYDIFASGARYDLVNLDINHTTFSKYNDIDIISYIEDYLDQKYDGVCSQDEGCIIPIKINSYTEQNIEFSDFEVKYKSGATFSSSNLYTIDEKVPTISSDVLKLDLSKANFRIPLSSSTSKFELYFDGVKKAGSTINVTKGFDFNLLENNFTVGLESEIIITTKENIKSVTWEFGDGINAESETAFIKHRYIQEGKYDLRVTLTRYDGTYSSKTFEINVGNSKLAVEKLITEKESKLNNITRQIRLYEPWVANVLNNLIGINSNSSLEGIKIKYNQASDASDYAYLVSELVAMDLPNSIYESQKATLPLAIGFNNIDASFINQASDGKMWDEKTINDAKIRLIDWNLKNFNSESEYKKINVKTDQGSSNLVSYYKVKINKNSNSDFIGQAFLLIDYPKENIVFKEDYGANEINNGASSATSIELDGLEVVEFVIASDIAPDELGAYIFPVEIGPELGIDDIVTTPTPPKRPYWTYIILIIAFFVVYIILQEWYKNRYEKYLFPNRDDLFNMINFINNSKISGMDNEKIINNLIKMKWKKEQISYAVKKLEGKRTGMWEIPIFKIFENMKVKKEIERRQNGPNQGTNFGA